LTDRRSTGGAWRAEKATGECDVARAVGVDLGERRIGVAVSDRSRTLASPRRVVLRSGDRQRDLASVAAIALEEEAGTVVVGLPLSLDGRRGPAAKAAEIDAEELAALLGPRGVDVVLWDERLTTVSAAAALRSAGRRSRKQRDVIDQSAAAVLLQSWLDAQAPRSTPASP